MRPALLLPLLALSCVPALARDGAALDRGTEFCHGQVAGIRSEFTTLLAEVAGPGGLKGAPKSLERAFYGQQHLALDAAWSLCETTQRGEPMACSGSTCNPAEKPAGTAPAWKMSGVPIYATVDQRITDGGECSIFGSRIDAHNRVSQASSPSELRRHMANLREASSLAAVEACLTLHKDKEASCEETRVGQRKMLTCK